MLPLRDINPTRSFPVVTVSLIIVNTLVFLYMLSLQAQGEQVLHAFVQRAAVIPLWLTGGTPPPQALDPVQLSVLTAMFLHGGFIHLAGNMLYLWIFGNNVEDAMGPMRFLLFYLLCGVIATIAQIATDPDSRVPMLGASGAIAGVLGAYLVRFPRAQVESCLFVFFFVTLIRLPAIIVLGFWFVLQFFRGTAALQTGEAGGVAWWAHIGGFLAGMILVALFAKRRQPRYNDW